MLKKIDNSLKKGNSHISILYPGLALSEKDTGYFSIGRIDHAIISKGAVIKMHPHVDDDILSYFRKGKVKHTDSEGFEEFITSGRLMLMKAGKMFYHEEAIQEDVEGLQIFIRPKEKGSVPQVTFQELDSKDSENHWRLIASPDNVTKLQFSSRTWIYDTKITTGTVLQLPEDKKTSLHYFMYIFQGEITVNGTVKLTKGESLLIKDENIVIISAKDAELVLFATDTEGMYYDGGMYSGNKFPL